jgi:hypothetical protein
MEFVPFPKIARLNREIVITEKIDGTNASVVIQDLALEDGLGEKLTPAVLGTFQGMTIRAGSRNRWITLQMDNHGFAKWVQDNAPTLIELLGPGQHFGEWWGRGIGKRHPHMSPKRFSLFNVGRWGEAPGGTAVPDLHVVPVLYRGLFDEGTIRECVNQLRERGSIADPMCKNPEGIIIYHTAAKTLFKVTLEKDESYKGAKDE